MSPDQAANIVKDAMRLESLSDVAIRTDEGFRPVLPPFAMTREPALIERGPANRINANYNTPPAVAARFTAKVNEARVHAAILNGEPGITPAVGSKALAYHSAYYEYSSDMLLEEINNDALTGAENGSDSIFRILDDHLANIYINENSISDLLKAEYADEYNEYLSAGNIEGLRERILSDASAVLDRSLHPNSRDIVVFSSPDPEVGTFPLFPEVKENSDTAYIAAASNKAAYISAFGRTAMDMAAKRSEILNNPNFIVEPDADVLAGQEAERRSGEDDLSDPQEQKNQQYRETFGYIKALTNSSVEVGDGFKSRDILSAIDRVYIDGGSPLTDMQIPRNPTVEYLMENVVPQVNDIIHDAIEEGRSVSVRAEGERDLKPVLGINDVNSISSGNLFSAERIAEADSFIKRANALETDVKKLNDALNTNVNKVMDSGLDGISYICNVLGDGSLLNIDSENVTDREMRALVGRIYIDGKNITDIVNKPVNAANMPDYVKAVKDALSPDNLSFVTVMRENSIEPDPKPVVMNIENKRLTPEQMDNWMAKLEAAKSYSENLRNNVIKEVTAATQKRSQTIEKLVGKENDPNAKKSDFFAWIDDYNNEVRAANPGIAENDKRLLTYDSALKSMNHFHLSKRSSLPFCFMSLYMMTQKDENGNNYTMDTILSDSPEALAAKKKIGRQFFETFSTNVPGVENPSAINSEAALKANENLRYKYESKMLPALREMSAKMAEMKFPYVDYSDPESIRENHMKQALMGSMLIDYAQDMHSSFIPSAIAQEKGLQPFIQFSRRRDGYIMSQAYKNGGVAAESPNDPNFGLNSNKNTMDELVHYESVVNSLGSDMLKRISDIPIGYLDRGAAEAISYQNFGEEERESHSVFGPSSLHNTEVIQNPDERRNAREASKAALQNGLDKIKNNTLSAENTPVSQESIQKFVDKVEAAEKKAEDRQVSPLTNLYMNAAPEFNVGCRPAPSVEQLKGMSTAQILSSLSGFPISELEHYNEQTYRAALGKLYINGRPVMEMMDFGKIDNTMENINKNFTAGNFEEFKAVRQAKELRYNYIKEEFDKAARFLVKTMEDSLVKGNSRDFVMLKTGDEFQAFKPLEKIVMPEPEKVERLSGFKKLIVSRQEINDNLAAVNQYEADKKTYESQLKEKKLINDIISDIDHKIGLLNSSGSKAKNVNQISVNVLEGGSRKTVTYEPTKFTNQKTNQNDGPQVHQAGK